MPFLARAFAPRASRMIEGRKNLSSSSTCHCLRKVAGTISRMRRRRSAHFCARMSEASMVLPRPTSSASKHALRVRRAQGEERGVDLVRVEVYTRVADRARDGVHAVVAGEAKAVRPELGVERGEHRCSCFRESVKSLRDRREAQLLPRSGAHRGEVLFRLFGHDAAQGAKRGIPVELLGEAVGCRELCVLVGVAQGVQRDISSAQRLQVMKQASVKAPLTFAHLRPRVVEADASGLDLVLVRAAG
jgi:hypothetical protein